MPPMASSTSSFFSRVGGGVTWTATLDEALLVQVARLSPHLATRGKISAWASVARALVLVPQGGQLTGFSARERFETLCAIHQGTGARPTRLARRLGRLLESIPMSLPAAGRVAGSSSSSSASGAAATITHRQGSRQISGRPYTGA
jgi:hypothetical protein